MTEYHSAFRDKITGFLDFHASCGFKRKPYLSDFLKFDRWCLENHPGQSALSRELVHEWIDDSAVSRSDASRRAVVMRQFGKYLAAIGEEAYVLSAKYAPVRSVAVPFLFTDDELSALFRAIDALPPTRREPFFNEIAPVLFRLIYTCGLRPNEGRELLEKNVNLLTGEILITHTKRNKERMVVMSDDMAVLARNYALRRAVFANGNPYFFPSNSGEALTRETVYSAFNRAWSLADTPDKRKKRVRVYDLRHRFASACLNRWMDEGENLMAMLPFLREYMGHETLSETAYYIHILPENLAKSPAIDWDSFNAIFPEVEHEE